MIQPQFTYDTAEEPEPWYKRLSEKLVFVLNHDLFNRFEPDSVVSIAFIHDKQMKELNRLYRKKDTTTDVLTFPILEQNPESFMVGEIIVSLDKARVDAKKFGISIEREIHQLIIHGLLHLVGFDHNNDLEEKEMELMEKKLLEQIPISEGVEGYAN